MLRYVTICIYHSYLYAILPMEGSLVDIRAHKPYTLVGPTVTIPVLTPSGTDASTTDYIYLSDWKFPQCREPMLPSHFLFLTVFPGKISCVKVKDVM